MNYSSFTPNASCPFKTGSLQNFSAIEFKVMCFRSRRGTGANSLGQSSALANASHIGIHNSAQVQSHTLNRGGGGNGDGDRTEFAKCRFSQKGVGRVITRQCTFTSSFSRTLPFTRQTWRTRPSCGCPSRPWRSWTGASTSWRQSRPTDQSPTWLQARYGASEKNFHQLRC